MKTWSIALKDTLITFRDRSALLLMIAAPLTIALVMGMAFGGQANDTVPISRIPTIIVNQDAGDLGGEFADIIAGIEIDTAEGEQPLFVVTEMDELEAAQNEIESGNARGVVFFPENFSANLRSGTGEDAETKTALVQVYTDPTAAVSTAIIRGVVGRIATGFSTVVIGNVVAVNQVLDQATDIPVVFVNEDTGPLAEAVNEAFSAENFSDLFILTTAGDLASAEAMLDSGEFEAVIHVPDTFSQDVMNGAAGESLVETVNVVSKDGSLSAPIVEDVAQAVVRGFGSDAGSAAASEDNPSAVLANLNNLEDILLAETASFGETEGARERITVNTSSVGDGEGFNLLNYFVPSMAIFFLMFTVFAGTRSILDEERDGTLHRLMSTPTSTSAIILGKILGTFMTGILQFIVLVVISGVFFSVDWGKEPLGMALMVLATVSAATSLGAFVASFARNVNQANAIGSGITMVSAILGGNFIDFRAIPEWLTPISRLTINRWALEGFFNLSFVGYTLPEVALNIFVLFGIAAVFFILSVLLFNRRFVA